ncbi:MAG: hypothetical protein V1493_00055 [Candidatus Diapherotrites archaeon]
MPRPRRRSEHARRAINLREVGGETVRIVATLEKGDRRVLRQARRAGFIKRTLRHGIFSLKPPYYAPAYYVPVSVPTKKTNRETRRVFQVTRKGVLSLKGTGREREIPAGKGEAIIIGYRFVPNDLGGNQFLGGFVGRLARLESQRVKQIKTAFSEGIETDPVLSEARRRYGLTAPPTYSFGAIFRPRQAVVEFRKGDSGKGEEYPRLVRLLDKRERAEFEREYSEAKPGETIVVKSKRALELAEVPEAQRAEHRLYLDRSLSEKRILDYPQMFTPEGAPIGGIGLKFWQDRFLDFDFRLEARGGKYIVSRLKGWKVIRTGVPFEDASNEIMEKFAAGLANGTHLCHEKLKSSFTMASPPGLEDLFGGSSLQLRDVALGNRFSGAEIHDLETIKDNPRNPEDLRRTDIDLVRENIRFLAKCMGVGERTSALGEARMGFTSRHAKYLYTHGMEVFNGLLALSRKQK